MATHLNGTRLNCIARPLTGATKQQIEKPPAQAQKPSLEGFTPAQIAQPLPTSAIGNTNLDSRPEANLQEQPAHQQDQGGSFANEVRDALLARAAIQAEDAPLKTRLKAGGTQMPSQPALNVESSATLSAQQKEPIAQQKQWDVINNGTKAITGMHAMLETSPNEELNKKLSTLVKNLLQARHGAAVSG